MEEVYAVGESKDPSSLWNRQQPEKVYYDGIEQLCTSTKYLDAAEETVILRESFIFGGEAIRCLALDPLLPAELANTSIRAAYTRAAKGFVTKYSKAWQTRLVLTQVMT
ncbi:MAG: hypothetical protein ACPG07_07105 [Henriciella sp.]